MEEAQAEEAYQAFLEVLVGHHQEVEGILPSQEVVEASFQEA